MKMEFQLAMTAIAVAGAPLALVWASKSLDKYRKLINTTLFLTFDLVVFGAFTRPY